MRNSPSIQRPRAFICSQVGTYMANEADLFWIEMLFRRIILLTLFFSVANFEIFLLCGKYNATVDLLHFDSSSRSLALIHSEQTRLKKSFKAFIVQRI